MKVAVLSQQNMPVFHNPELLQPLLWKYYKSISMNELSSMEYVSSSYLVFVLN